MRKIIFIILCFGSYQMMAQNYGSAVGVSAGYAENGVGVMADYNYYLAEFNSVHAAAYMTFADYKYHGIRIPYVVYALQLGYTYNVWANYNRNIKAFVLGGLQVGYESINNGEDQLEAGVVLKDKSKFIFGPYLGVEGDCLLSDDFSLIVRLNQSYHINSDAGKFTPYAGVGLRYFLY